MQGKAVSADVPREALKACLSKTGKYKAKNGMEYAVVKNNYSWDRKAKPIKCLATGKVWKSLTAASKDLGAVIKHSFSKSSDYIDDKGNKYIVVNSSEVNETKKSTSFNENTGLQQVAISLVEKGMYKEASEVTKVLAKLCKN